MSDDVLIQRSEGHVTVLELNRAASKNALNRALLEALGDALDRLPEQREIRAVVLTGSGGSFCSGADLKAAMVEDPDLVEHVPEHIDRFHRLIRGIARAPQPVIAAVDGPAVGFGCDLALACDLRLVTPATYFQERFVKIGLMPDGGGSFWLPRLVGTSRAMELMLTGDDVTGDEAVRLGIASRCVPPEDLLADAMSVARKIAAGPPIAVRHIKRAVRAGMDGTIDDALAREKAGQTECLRSGDAMEGIAAWMQKRAPEFRGE